MAKERSEIDWFAIMLGVVNPLLVMGLVGSLSFFLLDVLYRGIYDDRLRNTLFWFVFASVLIARISLTMGSRRASAYALLLGGATYLATMRFVDNANPLINLLIIALIAGSSYFVTRDTTWERTATSTLEPGLADALAEPWQLLALSRKQRRPHGLWVVWFTLAALPLFAIGQSMIPVPDSARRDTAFWRMTMYIACALGLLLTTALVNLRQYLKARKLKLPALLTGRWLITGALLILLALLIGALLPRPQSETSLLALTPWGSSQRDASKIAPGANNAGKGDGMARGKGDDEPKEGNQRSGQSDDKAKTKSDGGKKNEGGDKDKGKEKGGAEKGKKTDDTSSPRTDFMEKFGSLIQTLVRWLVILLVIVAIALFILRHLANLHGWAAAWWQKLLQMFGRTAVSEQETAEFVPPAPPPRPFAAYSNPFADGTAASRDGAELVRYSFAALEAWAREQGRPRKAHETALEFACAVGEMDRDMNEPVRHLASLYSRIAYTARHTAAREHEVAAMVWEAMASRFVGDSRATTC